MARKRYYRAKKTTPVKEVVFISILGLAFLVFAYPQKLPIYNVGSMLGILLPAILLPSVVLYLFFLHRQRKKLRALRALELSDVDTMKGEEFEAYVAELLKFQGYKTIPTPRTGDYGVDLVVSKNGIKIAIQLKRWKSKIDQGAIREAVAGKAVRHYGCTEAMVITNSTFTDHAKFLAGENNCKLVDREKLSEWILRFQAAYR